MRFNENDINIVCPWHGWEFNVETGRCAGDGKWSLRRFKVTENNGEIHVTV
jgi:nitrite reductase/ring-hydroxylating ferredoxin subunit